MPELPEVETIRRGLAPVLEGAYICEADVRRKDLRFPFPAGLAGKISGRHVLSVNRRAKYLLIMLDDGQVLVSHLGMSGSWRIDEQVSGGGFVWPRSEKTTHDHFVMQVEQDGDRFRITYNDPRRFGFLLLCSAEELASHPMLARLGIEPTGNMLSAAFLQNAFANKSAPLKAALLDQRIIAGLGNIYVCEALWRAGLSPMRKAATLAVSDAQVQAAASRLAEAIRDVIADAIAAGGSHLRDYVQADGSLGYFQHSFSVYGREKMPCPQCGTPVKRAIQGGRSTFYCEICQI